MNEIPEYYTILFRAVEQAIRAIEQQNYGMAKQLLLNGECEAEELFLVSGDETQQDSSQM